MSGRGETGDSGGETGRRARDLLREWLVVWGIVVAAIAALSALAEVVPLIDRYLSVLVAGVFVYVPLHRLDRLRANFEVFGLSWNGALRGAGWGLVAAMATVGPYAAGYFAWHAGWGDATVSFQWENFRRWEARAEGPPERSEPTEGVAVWTRDRGVVVAVAAGDSPATVRLRANRPISPEVRGSASLRPVSSGARERRERWRIDVEAGADGRAFVFPRRAGTRQLPTRLSVSVAGGDGGLPLRVGARGERVPGNSVELQRELRWIWLWALTHLVVVAFPEEFLYRGYLQTRIRQWLRAARCESGDSAQTRELAGMSEQNALTSVAFAVGHVAIPIGGVFVLQRASVFFPSLLFGWLREQTGSIAAPVVYHAACNMMVLLLGAHLF